MGATLNRRRLVLGLAAASLAVPGRAQPHQWPRTVRLVVPFAAGGLIDATARVHAEGLSRSLGVPVLVDNRPGVGGLTGVQQVTQAPADGSTWVFTTSGSLWQSRVLYRQVPFDADRDLVPVALLSAGSIVLAASEGTPVRTLAEFANWAKGRKVSIGSYAVGSYLHMVGDTLAKRQGMDLATVHYKGETPMWTDLAGGLLNVAGGSTSGFMSLSGRGLRAIGVAGAARSPRLPDVPTLMEQGLGDPVFRLTGGWMVVCAPAGTPAGILDDMARMTAEVEASPRMQAMQASLGAGTPSIIGRQQALAQWRAEAPQWIAVARELGIRLD